MISYKKVTILFILLSLTMFIFFNYNKKPVFTQFGFINLYPVFFPTSPYVDSYGNYLYADTDKNILLLIITDQNKKNSINYYTSRPIYKSIYNIVIFSGTEHETNIELTDNTLKVINFNNNKVQDFNIEKSFVTENCRTFSIISYTTENGQKSLLFYLNEKLDLKIPICNLPDNRGCWLDKLFSI